MREEIQKKIFENKKKNIFIYKTLNKLEYYLARTHLLIRLSLEDDIESAYQISVLYEKEKKHLEQKVKEPSCFIGKKRGRPSKSIIAGSL